MINLNTSFDSTKLYHHLSIKFHFQMYLLKGITLTVCWWTLLKLYLLILKLYYSHLEIQQNSAYLLFLVCGSHTRWELTTWADFQFFLHRLLMSTISKSSHSGFLDVSRSNGGLRRSGWIGQLLCLKIFSTSLSMAAFLHRAGGSMLESTGSHGTEGILCCHLKSYDFYTL